MKRRARRHAQVGLLPRLGQWMRVLGMALIRYPQPFMVGALLLGMSWTFWSYARHAEAFRITRVVLPPDSTLKLPEPLIGTNLWQTDLRALAMDLKSQQPWLKEVRVTRQAPNGLEIAVIPRVPVAQVHLDRWYPVDAEGFILPQVSAVPVKGFVQIVGCERSGNVKIGKVNSDERLRAALHTLRMLRRTPILVSRQVTEVNVADPQQIRFLIDRPATPFGGVPAGGEIEVRCGSDAELEAHLKRLHTALKAVTKQSLVVRYIDVRFAEPVIGPRS